jgi:hypothetical protein
MKRAKLAVWPIAFLFLAPLAWSGCAKNSSDPVILNPGPGQLAAREGFIAADQRVNELRAGGHPVIACATCHSYAVGGPVNRDCSDCHGTKAESLNHPALARCVDCHMPRATKQKASSTVYAADVRTHVIRIRPEPERKGSMFEEADGLEIVDVGPGLTLDLACYGCHKDESGVGGNYSRKTLKQLADKAPYIHANDAAPMGKEGR